MKTMLADIGELKVIPAHHARPIPNVREIIDTVKGATRQDRKRISIDISTFTRKHLLLLLQGLDLNDLLSDCRFFYTEQEDYNTKDDEPISSGLRDVKTIENI